MTASGPHIDPALGLDLKPERTLPTQERSVTVLIPAHNEEGTVSNVVQEARRSLSALSVPGRIIVAASACTDDTSDMAASAGAEVIETPLGKGAALRVGLADTTSDIVCIVDADVQYFGSPPLVELLVQPILNGIADAVISDLYWRPLYPQLWLYGFFAPLAGRIFPELLPRVGSTPWSGQRAALRHLWPTDLPDGFTVDLELLLHWNQHATNLRPVIADDWVNPQRPKPDLMEREFHLLIAHAIKAGRMTLDDQPRYDTWFAGIRRRMADYKHGEDAPHEFEQFILRAALSDLA